MVDASDHVVSDFVDAINALQADGRYLLDSLTEFVRTLAPVAPSSLSEEQRAFLLESGTFTADELVETQARIARGSFQLDSMEWWLSEMRATLSLRDIAAFLRRDEGAVREAVEKRQLYAVEIGGRLRFPMFQFSLRSEGRVLPHFAALLPALEARWGWTTISRFFATRQEDLVGKGWKTPASWLEDGGDPNDVLQIVESGGPQW